METPEKMVLLEFPLSRDPEQDESPLRTARLLPGFDAQAGESGRCRVRCGLEEAAALRDVVIDLWEQIHARPGAKLLLDSRPMAPDDLRQALKILDCGRAYDQERRGDAHCVPRSGWDWGCLYLADVPPQAGAQGVDRKAFKEALDREAETRWLTLCPHFDHARVAGKVDALPDAALNSLPKDRPAAAKPVKLVLSAPGAPPSAPDRTIQMTTYADVGGLDEVVATLRETIELPIRHPEVLRRLGVTPHRGVLLFGPPGCGKTLLARAVACESGARFLPVSGPELITKWHGESEEKLRELFQQAQEAQPTIIFFDEIDAIAQARSSSESLRLDARFTAQLLTLMDGIYDLGRVFILAATNRPDLLDQALLRPGRFDAVIEIPRPDQAGLKRILEIHARRLPLAEGVDLGKVARRMAGLTGADVAYVVREAAYACLRRSMPLGVALREAGAFSEATLRKLKVSEADLLAALGKLRKRNKAVLQDQDDGDASAAKQEE
ncbi:ATPase family associated with various cellular activities (AAA) [Humidesulfovibrio mexicanus]|uniref:ATPase family associated with various cellular activities (AAA) n=1 Tax=Humidesulfovibrio mexicanus TaxID=147047 RepID=A0A239CFS4_9BACT|nr:AAA family ATPase [Humidesulfovibrio mexicanus]SNS19086.1 ATPase family associated with various cellular activities (AAA) [Humidesulfovibrio mexicanus]